MKKQFLIILSVLLILTVVSVMYIINYRQQKMRVQKENSFYEAYIEKQISGVDLITLINKAMDSNDKKGIRKIGNYYQEDEEKSIKIYIQFSNNDKTFFMEDIADKTSETFVNLFATAQFECTKVEYHSKTGNLKSMTFQQK